MLKNYLLVAWRTLRTHRAYAAINGLGLALGTGVAVLILLYVAQVLTFDRFHANADELYFLYRTRPAPDGGVLPVNDTWYPLLDEVEAAFPDVVGGVRFLETTRWVEAGGSRSQQEVAFTDASLFEAFDGFDLARGDAATALADPGSVVVSAEAARALFGDADPIGQSLTIDFERTHTVTGVLAPLPPNSSWQFNLIAPLESLPFVAETGWDASYLYTFVRLAPGADPDALETAFPEIVDTFFRADEKGTLELRPLAEVDDSFTNRRSYAGILLAIAVGILLIACINFTNLALAQGLRRAREIGMRKVLGGRRVQLAAQFLGEAALLTFGALAAGLVLATVLMPAFGDLVQLDLTAGLLLQPRVLGGLLVLGLAVTLLAGGYPALVLSRYEPMRVLRGARSGGRSRWTLRGGLVVFQLAVAVVLLVSVGTMWRQVRFMQEQDLRFEGEDVVVLDVSARDYPDPDAAVGRIEAFKQDVAGLAGVEAATLSNSRPGQYRGSYTLVFPEDRRDAPPLDWRYATVDGAYFDTYGIDFVEGRGFDAARGADAEVVVINEAARRALGWETAVGRTLYNSRGEARPIVGVTADFHYQGLQQQVEPVLHFYGGPASGAYRFLSARIDRRAAADVLAGLQARWAAFDASRAFGYTFADAAFATLYETEQKLTRMVAIAALLAVLVACLGLLGLAAFAAQRRTKEIGVRKVLGASVRSVVALLARDYALLAAVAFLAAAPVAYLALDRWLDGFAYRVDLSPLTFLAAGLTALAFAVATVGTQALRAARADPVESLRAAS